MTMKSRFSAVKAVFLRSGWPKGLTRGLAALTIALAIGAAAGEARAATITVDASKQTAGNPHFWSAAFGTGKAHLTLRADWQTHVKIGNRELGAQRVRGHGLFNSGEMDLWKGTGQYDWTNLDTYLQAITSAGMRPIIETDFMPTGLGSSSSDAMHSPPKDYNEWKSFIKALVQHCVDKYGADDVGKWYWEIWNEPDYPGFWVNTDMNAYYTLYDNTVAAITSVLPNALVGGPATTNAGPVSAFLAHCKSAGTRVTFVSSHNYPGGANTGTSADANSLVTDNQTRLSAISSNGYTSSAVKSFNTEWNSSYSGQGGNTGDAVTSMDNHWNVGFILKAAKLLSDKETSDTPWIDVFSYWVLTDVFDEDGGTDGIHMTSMSSGNTPFGTVFGVMTFQGMRKAAFNAFKLLNYTGTKRLQSSGGTGSDGIDAMATSSDSGDSLQILLYNYYKTLNTASGSGDSVTINVSNLPSALAGKQVYVTQYTVDENHSNPYSVWVSQNKPASPSEAQWEAMHQAQHLAVTTAQKTVDTTFSTTITMLKQSGTLIIVSAARPLMGRNALVPIEAEDFDGQSGATKETSGDTSTLGQSITFGASGGNVFYDNVDFTDAGVTSVQLRVKSSADTTLELHQGTADGTLLAKCSVTNTSGAWADQTCNLSQAATGFSDKTPLYLVAAGALHLNHFTFQGSGTPAGSGGAGGGSTGAGAGGAAGTPGSGAGGAAGTKAGTGGSTGAGNGGASSGGNGGAAGSNTSGKGGSNASGNGGSTGTASNAGGSNGNGGSNGSGNGGASSGSDGGSTGSGSSNSGAGGISGSGGSVTPSGGKSGCSCSLGSGRAPSGALFLMGLAALLTGLRRRRARRGN